MDLHVPTQGPSRSMGTNMRVNCTRPQIDPTPFSDTDQTAEQAEGCVLESNFTTG